MVFFKPRPAKRPVARTTAMPAPVGGWNARDALSDMAPGDAITMRNWYPGTSDVMLRKGRTVWCTGLGAEVESLLNCTSPAAETLWAFAGTTLWNATTFNAPVAYATSPVPTLSNARWEHINMVSSGGVYAALAVNGVNKLIGFNGTLWNQDGDASATYNITGVDTASCGHINVHKFRVWLAQTNSLDAWYLGAGAINGVATRFTLNGVARSGGRLVALATWTIDAGYGVDDYAVFITSKGELIVYSGTDPASSATWQLVGVYQVGSPIGSRCFVKWGGDLLLITQDGLVPLSTALQSSRVEPVAAMSDKIRSAIMRAVTGYSSNFGWEVQPFPRENMLLLNVPVTTGKQEQYVMNVITESWCRFSGWDANCFELFGDNLYHGGGSGVVYRCWDGNSDQYFSSPDILGADIEADLQQAFSYLGGPANLKRFTMLRPVFSSTASDPPVLIGLNVDFDTSTPTNTLTGSPPSTVSSAWNTAQWNVSPWAGSQSIVRAWQGVIGLGYAASPHYVISTQGVDISLMATTVVYEIGGVM